MSSVGPSSPGRRAEGALLAKWMLRHDGEPLTTASSRLIPVRTADGEPAMLKLAHVEEEERGAHLLAALDGHGAARVLRLEGAAALLERATGHGDLARLPAQGRDDKATRIMCRAAQRLHDASRLVFDASDPPELIDLRTWFRELFARADAQSALHRRGADLANALLDDGPEPSVLHGDVHHGNVLDFGARGWLLIDPKALVGDALFDFCNLLCNPSLEFALRPGRLERQFAVVVHSARLTVDGAARLGHWLVAWCALSSTWFEIADDPGRAAQVAAIGERAVAAGLG
ncbi:aminoglycoside phosphotransferase family protein [Agromyces larvae]|uniref:Phosphotransferase n=1 Tax=Agromyces larvae TaxID=2929802 RepID=A0ABY4BYD9_9MICO|nr:aminoglycoside phosphotransferase family protein [Agromyces larvae]UOE44258.1 phosphotransferase [Agromyces larvae]